MGLFGGLGNILGKVSGVRIQPFKGKVGFKTPLQGMNTSDWLTVASLFAPGGNLLKMKGLGSLSSGNLLSNLGGLSLTSLYKNPALLASLLSGGNGKKTGQVLGVPQGLDQGGAIGQYSELLQSLLPGAKAEAGMLAGLSADRANMARSAAQRLTPGAQQASLDRQRSIMVDQAKRGVRAQELALGPAATGLRGGLELAAYNRANSQANQFQRDAYSPESQALMDERRLGFLDPRYYTTTLDSAMTGLNSLTGTLNQQRQADAAYRQSKPPTFLESILPLLGGMAGGVDWNTIFGIKQKK